MNYARQALENHPTVDAPTGTDRNADIVLTAAVIAIICCIASTSVRSSAAVRAGMR